MWRGLFIVLFLAFALRGEIIDRIAVSVGNQVITQDQLDDEIRISAFLNAAQPDFSAQARRAAAEQLIEQALIRREMNLTHYPLPDLSAADEQLKRIEAERGGRDKVLNDLTRYGISEEDLRKRLWWQLTLLKFIDERFRPTVQVSRVEVRQYYREQVEKWKQKGVNPIPSYQESRDAMEKALTEERVDQAVDRWLGDARRQVDIRYRKGVLP